MKKKESVEVPAELEQEIKSKNSKASKFIAVALCLIIILIEEVIFRTPPIASAAVGTVYFGMQTAEEWLNFKDFKRKTTAFKAVIFTLLFVACFVGLIIGFIKTA